LISFNLSDLSVRTTA